MTITIGGFSFPLDRTAVNVSTVHRNKRTRKRIHLTTVLARTHTQAAFLQEVQQLEGEVEKFHQGVTDVRLSAERFYTGRREEMHRTLDEPGGFAAFEIVLITTDSFERSVQLHEEVFPFTASGDAFSVTQAGNVNALPEWRVRTAGDLYQPTLSDGTSTIQYNDILSAGRELVFDSDRKQCFLDGATSALPRITGSFPVLYPGQTIITFSDGQGSSHSGTLTVRYRDTWI